MKRWRWSSDAANKPSGKLAAGFWGERRDPRLVVGKLLRQKGLPWPLPNLYRGLLGGKSRRTRVRTYYLGRVVLQIRKESSLAVSPDSLLKKGRSAQKSRGKMAAECAKPGRGPRPGYDGIADREAGRRKKPVGLFLITWLPKGNKSRSSVAGNRIPWQYDGRKRAAFVVEFLLIGEISD